MRVLLSRIREEAIRRQTTSTDQHEIEALTVFITAIDVIWNYYYM